MHRRTFLQAGSGIVGAGLYSGVVGADSGAQPSGSFEPLGSVDIPGATEAAVQDEFVYVAAGNGFAVVDITDPEEPSVIAQRRDIDTGTERPFRGLKDLWPWEDRLVIGGPANRNTNLAHGFALFDISDPASPEQITFYETGTPRQGGTYIHNSYFEDGIVYLTGNGYPEQPLLMIDVTDDDPEEVGRWSIVSDLDLGYGEVPLPLRSLHDVSVQDGIAYLPYWDAGTCIVDVSDPTNPTFLSHIGEYDPEELQEYTTSEALTEARLPPGNAHFTQVNEAGTILAVGEEAWEVESTDEGLIGGPGGINLYDISDKTDPAPLARIDAPSAPDQTRSAMFTTAHNLDIVDDRLYSSWYFGGVKLFDISDPTSPEEIAWWRQPEEASFWTAQAAEGTFVASSANVSAVLAEGLPQTREALYVFPDQAGEQENPPTIFGDSDGTSDGNGDETESDGNGDETDGDSTDDVEDNDDNSTDDGTSDNGENTNTDSSGPGFGIGTALAGLAGGYYLKRRQTRDE